jgi:MFS family permease
VRAGARRYLALLALPGARGPLIAAAIGSMPIGMFGLAILLLVRDASGSFAEGGRVVGAFGLANALGAVAQGRLMDRLGQPRVLRAAAAGHVTAIIALAVAARSGTPSWALGICAAVAGSCLPQVPAAMRSLWRTLVTDEDQRHTAYALGSIMFEVAVVSAPALVAILVALFSPLVAVLVAGVVCASGGFAFATTESSRRWKGVAHDTGWIGPLGSSGIRTVFTVLAAFGLAVGVVQVAVPAFAAERGHVETGGLLLAALSAGSLVGGLIYGARSWPGSPATRLAVLLLGLGGGFALLAAADASLVLGVLLLLTGMLLAPTTVVGSTLLDTAAPPGTATEAFTVMVMGIVAGSALGNAVGGAVVEAASYETAALCAALFAGSGAVLAVARRRTIAAA